MQAGRTTEASIILPIPGAAFAKQERQMTQGIKVPVPKGEVYSTRVLSNR